MLCPFSKKRVTFSYNKKSFLKSNDFRKLGTAGGTRTPDLLVRSQLLYPTELLPHVVLADDF